MSIPLLALVIKAERDIVTARQRARQVAELLAFERQDQVRIATAVSEIARNAFRYAGGGRITISLEGSTPPQLLQFIIADAGPGIAHLDDVLGGRYRSATGMGMGIVGSQRLMDRFVITAPSGQGTTVRMAKLLPRSAPVMQARAVGPLVARLAAERPRDVMAELEEQNHELLAALEEVRLRQIDLERVNDELEDTNRGVVALYAELDEKADHLRRADEAKTKFLSNMSHEFRTPLNSILALTRLLLDEMDGPLSAEQTVQVTLVRKAAQDLSELVNDLLDLAKVEAGKIVMRPTPFQVSTLFGALRGMLRPLLVAESVNLVFEEASDLPALFTDEAKVSQILRNFISNALKFTERGEVRVSAAAGPDEGQVTFAVADTGIGIPEEDQERIFQEFTQLEHPMQKRVRGTGLGLPLSRKLAQLLGGDLEVVSRPGLGSTFYARLPITYPEAIVDEAAAPEMAFTLAAGERLVLVVEDAPEAHMLYERLLDGTTFRPLTVSTVREAKREIQRQRPSAIILDIVLRHEDTWKFLAELKADEETSAIPVLIVSTIDDRQKGLSLGADAYAIKPVSRDWLLSHLAPEPLTPEPLAGPPADARPVGRRVLIVDDDPAARYVLRRLFASHWDVFEAPDGAIGVRMAQELRPTVMFLDLAMPRMSGVEVLRALRAQPSTARIPVIVATSMPLSAEERDTLALDAAAVLAKDQLARADAASIVEQALALAGVASPSAPLA